ncbi:methyl-accepting chemotaxis protein [Cytobacillus praedii]|uniref:Methyl-accepting chemotaxis protein n=1 Tax=Cytobacillus praedii TaxID=1742358 RepID=A0A4R1AQ78_9BACI|nr:methyl-accepting chemotaxis protein [Cytobacillus praedii]TCJ01642.1 methyl-accepting chemotaxis protein [Cytobacillus praedii]
MRMNVRKKLMLGFLLIIMLLAIISTSSYLQYDTINSNYTNAIDDGLKKINLVSNMQEAVLSEQIALRGFIINPDEANIKRFKRSHNDFVKSSKEMLNQKLDPQAEKIIKDLIDVEMQYQEVALEAIEYKKKDQLDEITRLMKIKGNAISGRVAENVEKALSNQEESFRETSKEQSNKITSMKTLLIVISIAAYIMAIGIAMYLSKIISNPVRQISKSAEQIAKGNLQVDEIKIKNRDEIGQLAKSFNQMTHNLRELIIQVEHTSGQVASSAEELTASAQQTNSATEQIVTAIQEVASGSEIQGKNTEDSAKAVNEMAMGIQRVAEKTSSVAESALDTTQQAVIGNDSILKVIEQMRSINSSTDETNKVIKELNSKSAEIGQIIDMITAIAEETNLLALNAAIESARAGEHGKGFAVVADEVKKLAEQSRTSANQIAALVHIIQNDTLRVVDMMGKSANEVNEGMDLVQDTGKTFDYIMKSIENVSAEVQELSAISEEMSASVEQVNSSIAEVSRIAKVSVERTGEIASASEEQLASMEEVTSSSTVLAKMAEDLKGLIKRFTI